jgi:hypothetical protein
MYKSVAESLEERCKFRYKESRCKPRSTSFRFQGRREKFGATLREVGLRITENDGKDGAQERF